MGLRPLAPFFGMDMQFLMAAMATRRPLPRRDMEAWRPQSCRLSASSAYATSPIVAFLITAVEVAFAYAVGRTRPNARRARPAIASSTIGVVASRQIVKARPAPTQKSF